MQVYLVTGGVNSNDNILDSTELLLPSTTSWTKINSAALPSPRNFLRGATLDNKVVVTGTNIDTLIIIRHNLFCKYYNLLLNAGGLDSSSEILDDVLEYDEESEVWIKIGTMSLKRMEHAVSVINYNSIKDYCN